MIFNPDRLWLRLQSSPFRAKFRLNPKDRLYLESKGLPLILSHARDFNRKSPGRRPAKE